MRFLKDIFVYIVFFVVIASWGFSLQRVSGAGSFYVQGVALYDQGRYESALGFLEKAFRVDPLNLKTCLYLGNIYNRKRFFGKAISSYLRGLELSPGGYRGIFLMNLGLTYQASGQYKEALRVYSILEKESRRYPALYLQKGIIFYKLENKSGLIKSWEHYLAKAPSNAQYKSIRAALEIVKGKDFIWSDKVGVSEVAQSMREEHKDVLGQKFKGEEESLTEEDLRLAEKDLLEELSGKRRSVTKDMVDKEIEKSILSVQIDSKGFKLVDLDIQEVVLDEEIER